MGMRCLARFGGDCGHGMEERLWGEDGLGFGLMEGGLGIFFIKG